MQKSTKIHSISNMQRIFNLSIFILFLLLSVHLFALEQNDTISGIVKNSNSKPLGSVKVVCDGFSTKTMRDGSFKLIIPISGATNNDSILRQHKPSTFFQNHNLSFSKEGFIPWFVPVSKGDINGSITVKITPAKDFTSLFDGKSLCLWQYDSKAWKVQDDAITGSVIKCMAFTKKEYISFRLIVSSRILAPVGKEYSSKNHHQGILMWGKKPEAGSFKMDGTLLVVPQCCWMWNYKSGGGLECDCAVPNSSEIFDWHQWSTTEILVDLEKGIIQTAVNGRKTTTYKAKDPKFWQKGPIGLMIHDGSSTVQYKNIWIEENPVNQQLKTLIL